MSRTGRPVLITGLAAFSAFGAGTDALLAGVLAGRPAFAPVTRFDTAGRRVAVAATAPGSPDLATELAGVADAACADAGLTTGQRADTGLVLAVHGDPTLPRAAAGDRAERSAGRLAADLARDGGFDAAVRAYTGACVAASTAVADAAVLIATGRAERLLVVAGYLVDADQFALFDAGRAMAVDGQVRPFSAGRRGLLLGDGLAAVVVESATAARARNAMVHATLAGWGRAGDAWHVARPRPDGLGLARAIGAALRRADAVPADVGYVNAHGSGTAASDAAETRALQAALGPAVDRIPVSSTKAIHGQALEASGLLELVVTVLSLGAGRLPVNAGFVGPDDECRLDLVLDAPRAAAPRYALSLNAAFGGANTALLVGAA